MNVEKSKITTSDGLSLQTYWYKGSDDSKGNVLMVHGMGEHAMRYEYWIKYLQEKGMGVLLYDQRGHGLSEGQRGHCPSYDALIEDLKAMQQLAWTISASTPWIVFGHSMGGNLVLNYGLQYPNNPFAGVITSAPWIELAFEPSKIQVFLGKLINGILPSFSQSSGLDVNAISRDPKEVARYENDTLVHDKITSNMFLSVHQAGKKILAFKKFSKPLLLYHGTGDQLTHYKSSENWFNALNEKHPLSVLKLWQDEFHEMHNDTHREEIFSFTFNWIETLLA